MKSLQSLGRVSNNVYLWFTAYEELVLPTIASQYHVRAHVSALPSMHRNPNVKPQLCLYDSQLLARKTYQSSTSLPFLYRIILYCAVHLLLFCQSNFKLLKLWSYHHFPQENISEHNRSTVKKYTNFLIFIFPLLT